MIHVTRDHIDAEALGTTIGAMPLYGIERALGEDDRIPDTGDKKVDFRLYDDDDELYFEGWLHDDDECVNQAAALRWGESFAGCTRIDVLRDGEWTQEIG